jgi:universal stress protein family protein
VFVSLAAPAGVVYHRQYAGLVERTLRDAAAALPRDLSVTMLLREGRPAHLLREEVGRAGHDLVVIGERPARGLARLVTSRERRIAGRLPTAVLLLGRPREASRRRRWSGLLGGGPKRRARARFSA